MPNAELCTPYTPNMNRFILALAALLLASCAGVDPSRLKPVSAGSSIELKSAVNYSAYYSFLGNRFDYTIEPGTYAARYEDGTGTYYEGLGKCLSIQLESDSMKRDGKPKASMQSLLCGLYIPNQASSEPKLYFYANSPLPAVSSNNMPIQGVGVPITTPITGVGTGIGLALVGVFAAAEQKNLHFHQDQPKSGQIRRALQ